MIASSPIPADVPPAPARPEKLTVEFIEEPEAVAIHIKRRSGPQIFLLLWLIGWTVGCIFILGVVIDDPSLGMFLFAVPFWASWLAVAAFVIWLMFGKETLLLRRDEALFLRTAFIRLSTRVVPRQEIQGFRECRSSHTENEQHLWGIEMVSLGKPLRFAFRLPDRERAWLIHQINLFLNAEGFDPALDESPPAEPVGRSVLGVISRSSQPAAICEAISVENTLSEPPSDCEWHLREDVDAFRFSQQGRLHIGAVAFLLFLNAFWNGIVAVFVMELFGLMPGNNGPQGWEWWSTFVFLIPFEVIGLALFAALIVSMLEPLRRTEWRFEPTRIVRQTVRPVYRRTRAWDVVILDRLELRRSCEDDPQAQDLAETTRNLTGEICFKLALFPATIPTCATSPT